MLPGRPGCSSASRVIASCDSPTTAGSVTVSSQKGAARAAAGPGRSRPGAGTGRSRCRPPSPRRRGRGRRCRRRRTARLIRRLMSRHDGGGACAVPGGVGGEPAAGAGAGLGGEVGVAHDLLVAPGPAARLGPPVVVPDHHRDAEQQRGRHPAGGDQLAELLAGKVGGERPLRVDVAVGPYGRADRPELQPGALERSNREPHRDDPVAADPGGLGLHPLHGRAPRGVERVAQAGGLDGAGHPAPAVPAGPAGDAAARGATAGEPTGAAGQAARPAAARPAPAVADAAVPVAGPADRVDTAAEDLPDRGEADRADRVMLGHGEVAGEAHGASGSVNRRSASAAPA